MRKKRRPRAKRERSVTRLVWTAMEEMVTGTALGELAVEDRKVARVVRRERKRALAGGM